MTPSIGERPIIGRSMLFQKLIFIDRALTRGFIFARNWHRAELRNSTGCHRRNQEYAPPNRLSTSSARIICSKHGSASGYAADAKQQRRAHPARDLDQLAILNATPGDNGLSPKLNTAPSFSSSQVETFFLGNLLFWTLRIWLSSPDI